MKFICFVLLMSSLMVGTSVHAHQERSYIFSGTVKQDSLFVEVIGHDNIWNVRYFFFNNLKEVYMPGELKNGVYVFADSAVQITIDKKKWKLKWQVNHKKWKTKISLLDTTTAQDERYFKKRVSKLIFEEQGRDNQVISVKEKHSGVVFFRLENPLNDSINEVLMKHHCAYAFHQMSGIKEPLSYEITHRSDLLSYQVQYDMEIEYFNYNIQSCLPIRLEDVVWFGEGEIPIYQSQKWFQYRYKVFPKKILPFLKVEDTCLEQLDLWQFPSWYLESSYLILKPFSAFGNENCNLTAKKIALEKFKTTITN